MTLEEILQKYFGCKKPFRKDGELTVDGARAYQRLDSLLDHLHTLGVITNSDYSRKLDEITNENI